MDNAKFKKFLEKELEKIADIVDDIYDKLEEVDDMEVFDSADEWLSGIKQLISYDDGETWNKFSDGPIFNTSHLEPGFIGTVSIINDENKWRMWYLSCRNWFEYENRVEPTYDIKYAESEDGINWVPKNLTCVGLDDDEGGISSQRILKLDDKYHMWYSIRKKTKYRNNIQNSYRIKKSISDDGLNWKKLNNIEIDVGAEDSWDSDMTCYPFIIQNKKKFIMFYNGNGFGKTGIGYATNFIVE